MLNDGEEQEQLPQGEVAVGDAATVCVEAAACTQEVDVIEERDLAGLMGGLSEDGLEPCAHVLSVPHVERIEQESEVGLAPCVYGSRAVEIAALYVAFGPVTERIGDEAKIP